MGAADGSGQDRTILGKEVNSPPVNLTVPRDHAVRGLSFLSHAKVNALRLGQHELLDKAPGVEQSLDPFSRGKLALAVLFLSCLGISLKDIPLHLTKFFLQLFSSFGHTFIPFPFPSAQRA